MKKNMKKHSFIKRTVCIILIIGCIIIGGYSYFVIGTDFYKTICNLPVDENGKRKNHIFTHMIRWQRHLKSVDLI